MNTLTSFELKSFARWAENLLKEAQLQNIWANEQDLILEFYKYKSFYLCFDLQQNRPYVVLLEKAPLISKKAKPVSLFLNAHAKSLRLMKIECLSEKGRVLELSLQGGERKCIVQAQLIPRSVNIIIEANDKKISWNKPRDLPESKITTESSNHSELNWEEQSLIWWNEKFKPKLEESKKSKEDPRIRILKKKTNALAQIDSFDYEAEIKKWRELGTLLKSGEQAPELYKNYYNNQKSQSWNMENCFQKAKELIRKLEGVNTRRELLTKEISQVKEDLLEHPNYQINLNKPLSTTSEKNLLKKSESKGRTLNLKNGLQAVCGKSARDNLAILRKAQSWDLWLHLKDYPGAHAIITRPRNMEVDLDCIEQVSQWLFQESFKGKSSKIGVKLDVVVVECRYVRPIKGDKLGRVTYHHPKVFSFASKDAITKTFV